MPSNELPPLGPDFGTVVRADRVQNIGGEQKVERNFGGQRIGQKYDSGFNAGGNFSGNRNFAAGLSFGGAFNVGGLVVSVLVVDSISAVAGWALVADLIRVDSISPADFAVPPHPNRPRPLQPNQPRPLQRN